MHQTEHTPFVGVARGLPRPVQIAIVVALAVIVLAAVVFKFAGGSGGSKPSATVSAKGTETASFRPSAEQLSNLTIVKVQNQAFRTEVVADGKIANNEDTTTPVFSPYSGR